MGNKHFQYISTKPFFVCYAVWTLKSNYETVPKIVTLPGLNSKLSIFTSIGRVNLKNFHAYDWVQKMVIKS